jgi:hypothetical protein
MSVRWATSSPAHGAKGPRRGQTPQWRPCKGCGRRTQILVGQRAAAWRVRVLSRALIYYCENETIDGVQFLPDPTAPSFLFALLPREHCGLLLPLKRVKVAYGGPPDSGEEIPLEGPMKVLLVCDTHAHKSLSE